VWNYTWIYLQLAEKRKKLVDEMSIRIQQKSDEYKLQFSNLTDDFNSREQELQKQVKALQVILH